MSNKKVIYLGGRISGLTYDEAIAKRSEAKKVLSKHFDILDPLRDKTILKTVGKIDRKITKDTVRESEITPKDIVHRDLKDLREADYLLVLTGDEASFGTMIEWGYMLALGKPIFVVASKDFGPWQRETATRVEPSIEEICNWLIKFWKQ